MVTLAVSAIYNSAGPSPGGLIPVSAPARRPLTPIPHASYVFLSRYKPLATSFQNLIVTPRLEFPATSTKQSLEPISNRYKTAISTIRPGIVALPVLSNEGRISNRRRRRLEPALTRPNSMRSKILIGVQTQKPGAKNDRPSLTHLPAFPIIAGFFPRVCAPVGGLCTEFLRPAFGRR